MKSFAPAERQPSNLPSLRSDGTKAETPSLTNMVRVGVFFLPDLAAAAKLHHRLPSSLLEEISLERRAVIPMEDERDRYADEDDVRPDDFSKMDE